MSHVQVPDVSISVVIAGTEIARFTFHRVDLAPQNWESTAAIYHPDAKSAIRACLLSAIAELQSVGWETYPYPIESGDTSDDQPPLF